MDFFKSSFFIFKILYINNLGFLGVLIIEKVKLYFILLKIIFFDEIPNDSKYVVIN